MRATQIWLIVILFMVLSTQEFYMSEQMETNQKNLKDERGNLTDAELSSFKKFIAEAEKQYTSNDYNRIAKYIFTGMKGLGGFFIWSIYVHEGIIKQISVSTKMMDYKKYGWLLNYGKYNLTYTIYGTNRQYGCSEYGGGGLAPFGADISSVNQQKLTAIVNDTILYYGDNIDGAVEYIREKAAANIGLGYWYALIADPTTNFGYYVCRSG